MPQSLNKVIVHIIFSTRIASLGSNQTSGLGCMLTLRQSAATSVLNSCASAVLLITFTLSRRCRELFSQAQLIEEIKKASSKWIKTLDARYRGFFWQRGYGAFR